MHTLVRKTLEIYLRENRVITQSEFPQEVLPYLQTRQSVFVTLYLEWKVIASSGRLDCKKENTVFECIDNALLCLKDPRMGQSLQDIGQLEQIHIRVDRFSFQRKENETPYLRILQNISELDITREGLVFLSQNLWLLSVILPHMVHVGSTPEAYFELACKKVHLDPKKLTHADYAVYALRTDQESDFQ